VAFTSARVAAPPRRTYLDTAPVSPDQRVRYWEDKCRASLVGLRCSSYADEGLLARQTSLDLGWLRVAQTSGNAHVIERTPDMIRAFPRESIFVNVVQQGETFVYQRGLCSKVQRGDVLIYDARHPYLIGCAENFSQLHIDIPAELFRARLVRADLNKPIQISAQASASRLYTRTLSTMLVDLLQARSEADPLTVDAEGIYSQVCDLLGAMMGIADGHGGATSALSASHLLAAKAHIEEHLGDDTLDSAQIALAVGVSERHLRRLFAAQGLSIAETLQERRLERAHAELQDPQLRGVSVSETAYRCGFTSHAHFSRVFKARYGCTPTALRQGRGA
jgi:AraC-like DNA-binding protein